VTDPPRLAIVALPALELLLKVVLPAGALRANRLLNYGSIL
jgi:hypothetical protein